MGGVSGTNAAPLSVCEHFCVLVKISFFDISISGCRTSERELSAVPTRCLHQYTSIFVFRFKTFFFEISIFGGRIGERKLSAVPTWCPDQCESIFVFPSKKFSSISRFLEVAQVKGWF